MKTSITNSLSLDSEGINYAKLANSFNGKYFLPQPLHIESWDVASIHTLLLLQKKNCDAKKMIKRSWGALLHQAKGTHDPCCIHLCDEQIDGFIAKHSSESSLDLHFFYEPETKLLQKELATKNLELLNSKRDEFPILILMNESKQAFTNFKDLSKALKKRNMTIQVQFREELKAFETLKASSKK